MYNKESHKKYYQKNKDKFAKWNREYKRKHDPKRYCKICKKELNGTYDRSYCSNCRNEEDYIEYKRNQINECVKKWYKKPGNKERVYAHIKRYRIENKADVNIKNNSRKRTIDFYKRNYYDWDRSKKTKDLFGDKVCKLCGSKTYVQFHHEIYPSKVKEIKQAILDGKIYFLCRKCHGKKRRK
jgi:hypothetical protein